MTREKLSQFLRRNKDSWGHHLKNHIYALIARRKVILLRLVGPKAVERKVKVQNKIREPSLRRKREIKGECS